MSDVVGPGVFLVEEEHRLVPRSLALTQHVSPEPDLTDVGVVEEQEPRPADGAVLEDGHVVKTVVTHHPAKEVGLLSDLIGRAGKDLREMQFVGQAIHEGVEIVKALLMRLPHDRDRYHQGSM